MADELGKDGLPIVRFDSREAYVGFLEREGASAPGLWAKIAKKGSGESTATYAELVDVSLRHGWIDSQVRRYDERFYVQRFTPRRPRSKWSRINRDSAERLIAAGEMRPGGLAEVERARADGRWEAAYEPPSTIEVPEDLRAALDAEPRAAALFAELTKSNRYSILFRVHEAKRADTRARRISNYVAMLARGERPHA